MRVFAIIIALLAACVTLFAANVRTTVKYVSTGTIYLDAGRSSGIAAGDTVEIKRGDVMIAVLTVTFVADNSASCATSEGVAAIAAGDEALVRATGQVPQTAQETEQPTEVNEVAEPVIRTRKASERQPNRLTGRIGIDYLVQDDREEFNYDYSQPSLSVRARMTNIQSSHISASLKMRLRKTVRDRQSSSATTTETSHRVYEAALRYENDESPIEFGVGRMIARELRGIGYMDGGYARFRFARSFFTGAFAGTEPDLENTDFQSDVTKGGVFVSYDDKRGQRDRLAATLSFAGTYEQGDVDREFIYQQISYSRGSELRIFESTEINLYRDWLKEKENKSLDLASVLLNARYAPSRAVAVSVSYDNRKSFYTYTSRSIPDSLFDDALRQGWRWSLETRFTRTFSTEVGAGLRTTSGDVKDTQTGWLNVRLADILGSGIHGNAQVRAYSGEYSDGVQPSFSLSRNIISEVNTTLQVGANKYTLNATDSEVNQNWLRLLVTVSLGSHLYGSLDAEATRGSSRNVNTISVGLGYRI